MKNQTLQYYMHDGPRAFRFELAGNLNREGAYQLDQAWRTASSVIGDRRLLVDLTYLTGADEQGRRLINRWHREGARLIAATKASRTLAESILGEPLPEPSAIAGATSASDGTWFPFQASFLARAVVLLFLAAIAFPVSASAAALKPETAAAWNDYLRTVDASLQDRVRPGGRFLWTFEDSERAARVRNGEIVVVPAPGQNPKKVPGGLIHHWIGAAFLPNFKLDDILEVTRDYDRYQEFYRPGVVKSTAIARSAAEDRFSMLLINKAFLLKTMLDTDCQMTKFRLDERRFYSVSKTTRVQEIEEYGERAERRIPEGEGSGYIWKLYSIARFEQREGGVYIELEALALSREIPAAVRLVADPIVRRVSRNSLLTSLQQTGAALRGNFVAGVGSAGVPADAGQLRKAPASPSRGSLLFTGVR
jgi:hypothetical protein